MPYLSSDIYKECADVEKFSVWVRKEFTCGLEKYQGEFIHAIVLGVRTEPNKSLSFQVVFTGYEADDGKTPNVHGGAMWAKLPLVALVGDISFDNPPRMKTHLAQPWNCSSVYHSITKYSFCDESPVICKIDNKFITGEYKFTVDYTRSCVSDDPAQHKQSHIIVLTEGEWRGNVVALPNNRIRASNPAYWVLGEGRPDFKPNPHSYSAEKDKSYLDAEYTFNNLYNEKIPKST